MVRTGLRTFLELQQDMEVVGEASSGGQVLALVAAMRPDIVLLDLVLPGLSGLETARRLRDTHPDVKVVVLTSFSGPGLGATRRAGWGGWLLAQGRRTGRACGRAAFGAPRRRVTAPAGRGGGDAFGHRP
jgi:CheY-like chemotaxis protein